MLARFILKPVISLLCWLSLGIAHADDPAPKRLVFFDVQVDEKLPALAGSVSQLTAGMENALVSVRGLSVISQSTRNSLILQKKMKLEDCNKAECRFAMVRGMGFIDLMLVAEVAPLDDSCTVSMKVQSMKDGSVLSSRFVESKCEVRALLATITNASRGIWPPAEAGTNDQASDILLSLGGGMKLQDVTGLPGEFRGAGSLNLDIEADVLVAYDAAVMADREGKDKPAEAIDAWQKLSAIEGENPYRDEAVKRAAEWQGLVDRRNAFQQQKKLDTVRMRKVMPLSTVPDASKKQLVAKYAGLYGAAEAVAVVSLLKGKLKSELCSSYFDKGANVTLSVTAIDENRAPLAAEVEIDGRKVGQTPLTLKIPSCSENLVVTAHEKDPWRYNLALSQAGGRADLQAELVPTAEVKESQSRREGIAKAMGVTGYVISGAGLLLTATASGVAWIERINYELPGRTQAQYDSSRSTIQTANKLIYVGYGSVAGGLVLVGVSWAVQ